jgi:hypothetical protein
MHRDLPKFATQLKLLLLAISCLSFSGQSVKAQQQSVLFFESKSPTARKILFIGNSLTFVNQLPLTLAALVFDSKTAQEMKLAEVVKGGATLKELYLDTDAAKTIKADGPWTDVVLQEQSQTMMQNPELTSQFAGIFAKAIVAAGARPVIYETWSHRDQAYSQGRIKEVLKNIAVANNALFVPAGEAFNICRNRHPDIVLYSDDRHPSQIGTYLAACVFYGKLFGRSPVGLPTDLSLVDPTSHVSAKLMSVDPKIAKTLQEIALEAVENN